MRRRQFLAGGAACCSVVLAGCADPDVVLDLSEATPRDLADKASRDLDPGTEEHVVVAGATGNGSITRHARWKRFPEASIVRVDGAFYDVSERRVGTGEARRYRLSVDFDPANTTPERGAIAVEDLPPIDRQRLEPLITPVPRPPDDGSDVTQEWGTAELLANRSVFAPEQRYDVIVDGDRRYRVGVSAETESMPEYRYEVTQVAPDVEAFAQHLRDRYLFELAGLSEDERSVVEEAIDGAYFDDDDAFGSVVETIRSHEGLNEADYYGTWLVAYEADEYLAYVEW